MRNLFDPFPHLKSLLVKEKESICVSVFSVVLFGSFFSVCSLFVCFQLYRALQLLL